MPDNELKLETKCYDANEYGYLYGLNQKIPDEEFLPNFWFVMRIIVLPTILIFAFITWIVDLIVVNLTPDEMVLGGGLLTVFIITACVGGGGTAIVIIIKD